MVSTHYGGEVELLRSHYKGLPNDESLVAFVDESYRLPGEAKPGESPFYTMTAVLLRRKDLLGTREDLTRIADGDYWHTVEFAQRAEGRDKIADMLDYLASYKDTCVISVHSSLGTEGDAKSMRQACLHTLVVALAGSGPDEGVTWSPVSMFVLERQRAIKDADRDLYTIKQARACASSYYCEARVASDRAPIVASGHGLPYLSSLHHTRRPAGSSAR